MDNNKSLLAQIVEPYTQLHTAEFRFYTSIKVHYFETDRERVQHIVYKAKRDIYDQISNALGFVSFSVKFKVVIVPDGGFDMVQKLIIEAVVTPEEQ
jgi:hypothetical protein